MNSEPLGVDRAQTRSRRAQCDTHESCLVIDATKKLDVAVGQVPRLISGLVQAPSRFSAKGMINELLCVSSGWLRYPRAKPNTSYVDLTHYADGSWSQILIEKCRSACSRSAGRCGWMHSAGAWPDLCRCGNDSALRRPVVVEDTVGQRLGRINAQGIPTGKQAAQSGLAAANPALRDSRPVRRNKTDSDRLGH
jgi:hypothetical protein